jgi:hypothetical protein
VPGLGIVAIWAVFAAALAAIAAFQVILFSKYNITFFG